jgi:hypothetical protein
MMFVSLYSNAQEHSVYKCESISQRDSITTDLLKKGYIKYDCGKTGLYLDLQSDNTFCLSFDLKGYREVSKSQLFSLIKENVNYTEDKPSVKTLENYLSDTDSFTGEKTYRGGDGCIRFNRYVNKTSSTQYLYISVNGRTLNYGCEGVYILFENGEKIIRSKEKVDTDYSSSSGWDYTAFFTPTANEIKLLQTQKVTGVKLYIYANENFSETTQNTILEDAKILLKMPKPKPQVKKK